MGPSKAIERFADAINPTPTAVSQQFVSPTLKNLLATPDMSVQPVMMNPLQRELDIIEVTAYPVTLIETADDDDDSNLTATANATACPDMSQYIRMDEIPCWNCTLP
jgi:hypothetical protein